VEMPGRCVYSCILTCGLLPDVLNTSYFCYSISPLQDVFFVVVAVVSVELRVPLPGQVH
jgi:hypothetical protein